MTGAPVPGRAEALDFVHETFPRRVLFGAGRRREVPQELERLGAERVLVVSGAHERAVADQLADALGDRLAGRIGRVRQHVPREDAQAARALVDATGTDAVVTIGGGSATGLGKAVAATHAVHLVAIPTTYAGSEMTAVWGESDGSRKHTGALARVRPGVVVYDPELTVSLPLAVTGASALNAMTHAVEALWADVRDPVAELTATDAIRAITGALPVLVVTPDDPDARSALLYGAYRAGDVLAGAGLQHRVAHVLGGRFGLDHAGVHAVLLPHLVGWRAPSDAGRTGRLAWAVGATDPAGALYDLAARTGAPTSLRDLGMPRDGIDVVVADLLAEGDASRLPSGAVLRELLDAAWRGDRPVVP